MTEKFSVFNNGLKINGILYVNNKAGRLPAIIMSHGFTGNYTHFEYLAGQFMKAGYAVFCFNFCGGGSFDEYEGKSEGKSTDMTISTEVADLCNVFEYASSQEYVDEEHIYLLGESQGGFVSGLAAAKLKDKICKLIMIYPALCIPDHARAGWLAGANYNPKNPPEEMKVRYTTVGKKLHEDVFSMNPYKELAEYEGDVLIIHGTKDDLVYYPYSNLAVFGYKENQCRLQMVRDMGHGYHDGFEESVFKSVKYFILDKKEIFNFRIIVTDCISDEKNGETHLDIYFTGYCESDIFLGTVTNGIDHQVYINDKCVSMTAEYSFTGIDSNGKKCTLDVINKSDGNDWKPVIKTNSEVLSWLNGADLYATLENSKTGPTVRIYK